MNTGLWNMDSGFAASRRLGMTIYCATPPYAHCPKRNDNMAGAMASPSPPSAEIRRDMVIAIKDIDILVQLWYK
jgi:ornithine carbamoyltransferase